MDWPAAGQSHWPEAIYQKRPWHRACDTPSPAAPAQSCLLACGAGSLQAVLRARRESSPTPAPHCCPDAGDRDEWLDYFLLPLLLQVLARVCLWLGDLSSQETKREKTAKWKEATPRCRQGKSTKAASRNSTPDDGHPHCLARVPLSVPQGDSWRLEERFHRAPAIPPRMPSPARTGGGSRWLPLASRGPRSSSRRHPGTRGPDTAGDAPRKQLSSMGITFTILAPLALQPPSDGTHATQYKVPCYKHSSFIIFFLKPAPVTNTDGSL